MKKLPPFLLSVLSGLLLFAAWPVSPLTFLVFIAWIPLLWLEQQRMRRIKYFGWVYLTMLIWNATTTWWIWNASEPGAVGAILANSLLMCLPWMGLRFVKNRLGEKTGYIALVAFWLTFEYIHLHDWGLSWPWLTLGNVFACHPSWVQWYEYTGASGGGLWVLTVNVLIFQMLRTRRFRPVGLWVSGVILIPLLISLLLSVNVSISLPYTAQNIVIVQPNIDPYEKISTGSFDAQLQKLIHISESGIDDNTVLVVWPETALYMENGIGEDHMKQNYFLAPLWDFLRRHPHINLLTGIESFRFFDSPHSPGSRLIPGSAKYYESYNAAAILDSTGPVAFYHKSMLVPGVETLPPFLHFLDAWFEKFGGTTSGYTGQAERTVLSTTNNTYHIAPAVCYESIYGEFMSRYAQNGADLIAVITNDGWWGNTPGYHQHENYARLRSIETRRWLVRSANTGVSCVITPYGDILDPQPWFQEAYIKTTVPALHKETFYTRFGDIISKLAAAVAVLLLGWVIVQIIKTRKKKRG